jgi:hypothetical protein
MHGNRVQSGAVWQCTNAVRETRKGDGERDSEKAELETHIVTAPFLAGPVLGPAQRGLGFLQGHRDLAAAVVKVVHRRRVLVELLRGGAVVPFRSLLCS